MGRKQSHGMRKTKEYTAWSHMKDRCLNPKNKRYPDYGGRGITVCNEWMNFETFFADMGLAPSKKHTLERKENNKGYTPENCIWATTERQAINKRTTVIIEINGISKSKREWLMQYNINRGTFDKRKRSGMSNEQALNAPILDSKDFLSSKVDYKLKRDEKGRLLPREK